MTSGFDIAHKLTLEAQQNKQNAMVSELIGVLRTQAETSRRSQRASAWIAGGSLVVAAGSLAVAIVAVSF